MFVTCAVAAVASGEERDALVSLASASNIDGWQRRRGWLSAAHHCDWEGVGCDGNGDAGFPESARAVPSEASPRLARA